VLVICVPFLPPHTVFLPPVYPQFPASLGAAYDPVALCGGFGNWLTPGAHTGDPGTEWVVGWKTEAGVVSKMHRLNVAYLYNLRECTCV